MAAPVSDPAHLLRRLDEFSHLDVFLVVEGGAKAACFEDLWSMQWIDPVAFAFRNTVDRHKE